MADSPRYSGTIRHAPADSGFPLQRGAVVRIRPAAQQLRTIPEVARDTPEVVARRPLPLDA
jgi:hypothetical protein